MSKPTIEQKLMVMAKAFYDDCKNDEDYPHEDVSGQYDEFKELLENGDISMAFINTCYEFNS